MPDQAHNHRYDQGAMKRHSIKGRLTAAILLCILIFGGLSCYVGYEENLRADRKILQTYQENCAAFIAETLSGVRLNELVGDSSGKYQAYEMLLESFREKMKLKYVYIYIPAENAKSLTNIFVLGLPADEKWKPGEVVHQEFSGKVVDVYQGKIESAKKTTQNSYGNVLTVYWPVYGPDGNIQAVAGLDKDFDSMVMIFLNEIKWIFVLIFLGCIILILILLVLSKRLVIRPLQQLSEHMENFVHNKAIGGRFERMKITTDDELGRISQSFNVMAEDVETYLTQVTEMTAEAEKLSTQMEVARNIQMRSLPDGKNPYALDTRFNIWADMKPARFVGGDLYDFFQLPDDRLCVVIGDVSGKGVTAALFMMRAKTLIKEQALSGNSLSGVLSRANKELYERNDEGMFVTLFIGALDLESGLFQYANAGHNPPYVGRKSFEAMQIRKACPLGIFDDEEYEDEEIYLTPGESIFLYTDGVTEAENGSRSMFGEMRMKEVLDSYQAKSCDVIVNVMAESIHEYVEEAVQSDDITMLILRWNGNGNQVSVTVEAQMENIQVLREQVNRVVCKDSPYLHDLHLALEEVYVNIVNYAYKDCKNDTNKVVQFTCRNQNGRLEMIFCDYGKPFNPLEQIEPDIDAPLEERSLGGLGIFFTRKIMDETIYERSGGANLFTMWKMITQEEQNKQNLDV